VSIKSKRRCGVLANRSEPTHQAAYGVVEALAAEQIAFGHDDVIIDAVNGVELAHAHWRRLAVRLPVELKFIEVQCSDEQVHRRRLAQRQRGSRASPSRPGKGFSGVVPSSLRDR
jgi:predicted kinase